MECKLTYSNFYYKIHFQAYFHVFQKKGKIYSVMFKFPPIDWCEMNDGKFQPLNFLKMILNGIKNTASKMFHKCPFEGN